MHFTLCVPARNEAANIQDAIKRLVLVLSNSGFDWRVVVAINGTTDNTIGQINEYRILNIEYREKIQVIECPEMGHESTKGAAIKQAAQWTKDQGLKTNDEAGIFGFIDADLSADPEVIPIMLRMITDGQADIVIGSRLVDTKTTNRGMLRTMSSQFFNLMSRIILGLTVQDAQCGLKVMDSKGLEVLRRCEENGWFLDIEFLAKAVQDGLRIAEMPVPWTEFRYAGRKSQVRMLKDGIGAIRAMWRIRTRRKRDHV